MQGRRALLSEHVGSELSDIAKALARGPGHSSCCRLRKPRRAPGTADRTSRYPGEDAEPRKRALHGLARGGLLAAQGDCRLPAG
eukprot:1100175-Heterocapsa_arctica.AAC.1